MQEDVKQRETAAILAGLRLLQRAGRDLPVGIDDVATNGGECEVLEPEDIDELCERINCDGITIGDEA